jgi:hypothetical protein
MINLNGQKKQTQLFAAEKSALHATSVGRTKRKRAATTLHHRDPSGGEYNISSQKK